MSKALRGLGQVAGLVSAAAPARGRLHIAAIVGALRGASLVGVNGSEVLSTLS